MVCAVALLPDVMKALRFLAKGEGYVAETVNCPAAALHAIEARDFDEHSPLIRASSASANRIAPSVLHKGQALRKPAPAGLVPSPA